MQVRESGGTQLAVIEPVSGGFPRHSHDEYVISVNLTGREPYASTGRPSTSTSTR
ncbi:MAG: hypothetical protein HOW71_21480 [Nonomuraea sp.]|nr:hypothetical protein [Nonomuraea sp.]